LRSASTIRPRTALTARKVLRKRACDSRRSQNRER
jgi:hypothetical protein